jgi:hypothetical protein
MQLRGYVVRVDSGKDKAPNGAAGHSAVGVVFTE